jgi:hypothetical protein
LCAAVNSEPYEDDDRIVPTSGINELIYGIMESLTDEQVLNWCLIVLENKGFWDDMHQKFTGLADGAEGKLKAIKKFISRKIKKNKIKKPTYTNI